MEPSRLARLAIALWVVAIAAAATLWMSARSKGSGAVSPTDIRQPITLPYEGRDAILSGMRELMTSVHGVMLSCAKGDTAGIRRAASQSGMAMAPGPGLVERLPPEFTALAERVHRGFDDVAAAVGMPKDTIAARMAAVTTVCVMCHATYRLVGQ